MELDPFYREFFSGSTCLDPLSSWEMCGVSGENGADFGESSSRSRMIERGPIIWCLQKNPLKSTKCHLVIHAFVWHGRLNYFGRS